MNVLTKTCRGFVKRTAAYIVAGAVAVSLIPAAVSAEETVAAPTLWETVSEINMDGFPETAQNIYGYNVEKTVNGKTYGVATDGGGGQWIVRKDSVIRALKEEEKNGLPDFAGNNTATVNRRWTEYGYRDSSGTWRQGVWPDSKSGIVVKGLYDDDEISVGDKIRVTVYAWADNVCSEEDKELTDTSANFRAYVNKPWASVSDTGYNTKATVSDMSFIGKLPLNTWNEISVEYEVNTANNAARCIKIDNYGDDGKYTLDLMIAGVKVEKQIKADTAYKKTIATVNMDNFPATEKSKNGYSVSKTVEGKAYTVRTETGADPWIVHPNSAIRDMTTAEKNGIPGIAGNKVATVERGYVSSANAKPDTSSGIIVKNLFDDSQVKVGDRIRVTAYVQAGGVFDIAAKDFSKDQTQPVSFRVYVCKPWEKDDQTKYNSQADITEMSFVGKLSAGVWNEVTIEYTVTDENKTARDIRIDNKKLDTDAVYANELLVAGVTVEKLENGGWYTADANGNAAGEIYASNAGVAEGSKIMVAAYEGDTFLGCDILDVNGEVSSFNVTGAVKADKVCAYVWDMTTLKPQTGIIGLTKAE